MKKIRKNRKNRKNRRKKNKSQVYRNPQPKRYEPEFVIAMLKKSYPDAPFFKEFCAGCHEQKATQMISVWVGHDEAKALYTLCPSCAQTIQHGTSAGVALLNQKIESNLKAWLGTMRGNEVQR